MIEAIATYRPTFPRLLLRWVPAVFQASPKGFEIHPLVEQLRRENQALRRPMRQGYLAEDERPH